MEKESLYTLMLESEKKALTTEELEKVSELLANTNAVGALIKAKNVLENQIQKNDVALLYGLSENLFHQSCAIRKNEEKRHAPDFTKRLIDSITEFAYSTQTLIAAKLVDEGRYDEFQSIRYKGVNDGKRDYYEYLLHRVNTLSGIEYLERENLIPSTYFKAKDEHKYPPLSFASAEQIEFYITHGAELNAVYPGGTPLDAMIYRRAPAENIEKMYELGGKANSKNQLEHVCADISRRWDVAKINDNIENYLKIANVLLQHGAKLSEKKYMLLLQDKELLDRYPSIMNEILLHAHAAKDPLQVKRDMLRQKLGDKVGKTADVETGKVSDEHRETAKAQVEISKALIKTKRAKEGKE